MFHTIWAFKIVYEIEVEDLNYQIYYLHNENAKEANKEWIEQKLK